MLDVPKNEEYKLFDTPAAFSEKGERKTTDSELADAMFHIAKIWRPTGEIPTHESVEKDLRAVYRYDARTGEPLESLVVDAAIDKTMRRYTRRFGPFDKSVKLRTSGKEPFTQTGEKGLSSDELVEAMRDEVEKMKKMERIGKRANPELIERGLRAELKFDTHTGKPFKPQLVDEIVSKAMSRLEGTKKIRP